MSILDIKSEEESLENFKGKYWKINRRRQNYRWKFDERLLEPSR